MPPPPRDIVDVAGGPVRAGDQGVDKGGLPDPGVADEDGDPVGEPGPQLGEPGRRVGLDGEDDIRDVERGVLREEVGGVDEVGLGEDEQRGHPGIEGGDEAAVDEPRAWLGVGQGGDDGELVGIGDDGPLDAVGVLGAAAQHPTAPLDADDPGQRPRRPADVADEGDIVADDDPGAAQLAGPHRHDHPLGLAAPDDPGVDEAGVPAPVDPDDERRIGSPVLGSVLASGPRAAGVGADPDVRLVEMFPAHGATCSTCSTCSTWASMASHIRTNPGRVLAVVATFSTSTPGTRSPRTAPKVAMRWSW